MECKSDSIINISSCQNVLIETLWNVNLSGRSSKRISVAVLIETLWNVNKATVILIRKRLMY